MSKRSVRMTINGREYSGEVEPRKLLTDFIRDDLGLTGTMSAASMACAAPARFC